MDYFYLAVALFLLATLVGGLWRIHRGPSPADRMLAAQLFGTTGAAILLLLSEALRLPAARDAALVFAVLAVVNVFTFVHGRWPSDRKG